MSYFDIDSLSPKRLLVEYILECRGKGHFLSYDEYELVEHWLSLAGSADQVLVVLSDILPAFYEKIDRRRSLKSINSKVIKKLEEVRFRAVDLGEMK